MQCEVYKRLGQCEAIRLQRENAELRAKLEKAETVLQDLKNKHDYVKRCNAENAKFCDDIVQENAELRKQVLQLTNSNKGLTIDCELAWDDKTKAEQQLAEANATIAQMRSALEEYFRWRSVCGDCNKSEKELIEHLDKVDLLARKALSTTPSQAEERQKRIVEAAKDVDSEMNNPENCNIPGPESRLGRAINGLIAAIKEAE